MEKNCYQKKSVFIMCRKNPIIVSDFIIPFIFGNIAIVDIIINCQKTSNYYHYISSI